MLLIAVFASVHLVVNAFLGMHFDEANWWLTTKHLEAGYFFHPPFVTYELFVITKVLGESLFALRLGSLLFTLGSILLVHSLALEFFNDRRKAFLAALVFAVLPATNYWLLLAHQEAPFIFFWLLTMRLVWRALSRESRGYWYLAGFTAGMTLLCKLQTVLFLPCLLLFLLFSGEHRHWLKRKEPYLALLVVLIIFTPTLIWYASHNFEPITYQLLNRTGVASRSVGAWISRILNHWWGSMIVISPFVWLLGLFGMVYGGFLAFKERQRNFLFLFCFSVPVVAFFGVTGGFPYWPFCGYISSLIAGMGALPVFVSRRDGGWLRKSLMPAAIALLVMVPLIASSFYCWFSISASRAHNGWKELGVELRGIKEGMQAPEVYLAGPYHYIVNGAAYYLRDYFNGYTLMFRVYEQENFGVDTRYTPWVPISELVGKDIIFVDEKDNPDGFATPVSYWEEKLPPYFEKVEGPFTLTLERKGREFRTFYIFKCYGFRGPDDGMDVKGDLRRYVGQS